MQHATLSPSFPALPIADYEGSAAAALSQLAEVDTAATAAIVCFTRPAQVSTKGFNDEFLEPGSRSLLSC